MTCGNRKRCGGGGAGVTDCKPGTSLVAAFRMEIREEMTDDSQARILAHPGSLF